MTFKINGTDVLPFVDNEGFAWGRNDIDSSDAGRTMDGTMHRGRIAIKRRIDITCKPLSTEQTMLLMSLIRPEFVEVEYTDPMDGLIYATMYSNNVPATVMAINDDGSAIWKGIKFPLIEK